MANLTTLLILFVCMVNITAFFPKFLSIRRKITGDIIKDKKCFTCLSSASAASGDKNLTDKKPKLYTFYRLVCNDRNIKEVFTGYTTSTLELMLKTHECRCNNEDNSAYNRALYKIVRANGGLTNWSIVILEKCHFDVIKEAKRKKREWIENTSNDVNMVRPTITVEEVKEYNDKFSKLYKTLNKVNILAYNKKYYMNHKVEARKYYADNRKKLLAIRKKKLALKNWHVKQKSIQHDKYIHDKSIQ